MSIRPEFAVHKLNDPGLAKANEIAEAFSELLTKLDAIIPPGRPAALVVTKLQEASFWAKRSVATVAENQLP